jgi:hypothetical protein
MSTAFYGRGIPPELAIQPLGEFAQLNEPPDSRLLPLEARRIPVRAARARHYEHARRVDPRRLQPETDGAAVPERTRDRLRCLLAVECHYRRRVALDLLEEPRNVVLAGEPVVVRRGDMLREISEADPVARDRHVVGGSESVWRQPCLEQVPPELVPRSGVVVGRASLTSSRPRCRRR